MPEHGGTRPVVHLELHTGDLPRAASFHAELCGWQPDRLTTPFGTYVAEVAVRPKRKRLRRLAEVAAEWDGCAEDWSTSTRLLCRACSEGRLHECHDTKAAPPDGVRRAGAPASLPPGSRR